jgi:hypothetical protein
MAEAVPETDDSRWRSNYEPSIGRSTSEPAPRVILPKSVPTGEKAGSFLRGSFGTIAIVVVIMLVKGGGRVAKHFARERQQPVAPAQLDAHQEEELQRVLQEMEDQIARKKAMREGAFPPNIQPEQGIPPHIQPLRIPLDQAQPPIE